MLQHLSSCKVAVRDHVILPVSVCVSQAYYQLLSFAVSEKKGTCAARRVWAVALRAFT